MRLRFRRADAEGFTGDAEHRLLETTSGADGNYHLEIPGLKKPTQISIDASNPGYQRRSGPFCCTLPFPTVTVSPGAASNAAITLKPGVYFSGVVIDQSGAPIAGVEIDANADNAQASAGIERAVTDMAGKFELFNYASVPMKIDGEVTVGKVDLFHPDYVADSFGDLYKLGPDQRATLRVALRTGHSVSGTIYSAGKPAPHVSVRAERTADLTDAPIKPSKDAVDKIMNHVRYSKGVESDAQGRFTLRGLVAGETAFTFLDLVHEQKARYDIQIDQDLRGLTMSLHSMDLPANIKTYDVLGMRLADMTPEIGRAFDRQVRRKRGLNWNNGVIILDPGRNSERLGIGRLGKGDVFIIVGKKYVGSVQEFVASLLLETLLEPKKASPKVRAVYGSSNDQYDFTNSQFLRLTPDDVKQLRAAWESFNVLKR